MLGLLHEHSELVEADDLEGAAEVEKEMTELTEELDEIDDELFEKSFSDFFNRNFADIYFRWRTRRDITDTTLGERIVEMFLAAGVSTGPIQDIIINDLFDELRRARNEALVDIETDEIRGDENKEEKIIREMEVQEEVYGILFREFFDKPLNEVTDKELGTRVLLLLMAATDENW